MRDKQYPLGSDEEKARFRKTLTYFRSAYICGDERPDAIDETIQRLLNELSGENMCYMDLHQVVVTPVPLFDYPEDDPRRMQYIVTILAKVANGYPRHIPQSRTSCRRNKEDREKYESFRREGGVKNEPL